MIKEIELDDLGSVEHFIIEEAPKGSFYENHSVAPDQARKFLELFLLKGCFVGYIDREGDKVHAVMIGVPFPKITSSEDGWECFGWYGRNGRGKQLLDHFIAKKKGLLLRLNIMASTVPKFRRLFLDRYEFKEDQVTFIKTL